jgi:hypothetical protein
MLQNVMQDIENVGSCEHKNNPSGSIIGSNISGPAEILKKDSSPWSWTIISKYLVHITAIFC